MKKVHGKHDTEANLALEKKLKSWLENSPIYLFLQWFDTVEGVTVSSKILSKRWTTEITKRDKMFFDKLGVSLLYWFEYMLANFLASTQCHLNLDNPSEIIMKSSFKTTLLTR